MKRHETRLDELLDRHLGLFKASLRENPAAAQETILQKLRSQHEIATEQESSQQVRPKSPWRLGLVAAAAAFVLVLTVLVISIQRSERFDAHAIVESGDGKVLQVGERIDSGRIVSTNGAGATLILGDGSRVEMRAQSELVFERAADGVRIRLNKGSVIVDAAKQHGHLYVQTNDVTVSVVGTVFLVNSEAEGSRVAVIEGEVRVQQQGTTEQKLRPGDQVMTKPQMEWRPVSEEFSWSQNKETHLALLQQSVVAPAEPREAFEVVSVKRSPVVAPPEGNGPRGGGGVRIRNPRPPGEACDRSNEPVIDPRRFDAANTTLYNLVTWAYGLDCKAWLGGSNFLFGGPAWIKTDGFDIQAVIPEGNPGYTADQFRAHDAPRLQKMLQSMLEDRFNLVVHRELKEMQVYVLMVAKGGPKLIAKLMNTNPAGFGGTLNIGLQAWKEGDNPCCDLMFDGTIGGQKKSIADLSAELGVPLGQPVLDRTGLSGEFNYLLRFQPKNPPNPDSPGLGDLIERDLGVHFSAPGTRSVVAAVEQELGLHLESTKEKVEVLVIDRVEKPSEN